jgi:hypothetical protein
MLGYVRVVRVMKVILWYGRVVTVRGTPRYAGAGTGDAGIRWRWHGGRRGTLGLARGTPRGTSGGTGTPRGGGGNVICSNYCNCYATYNR